MTDLIGEFRDPEVYIAAFRVLSALERERDKLEAEIAALRARMKLIDAGWTLPATVKRA